MKHIVIALAAFAAVGCRMAPMLEAPSIQSSEFGLPLARAGNLHESDIARWRDTDVKLTWPATLAVLQLHRDNRYAALSQDEWDVAIRESGAVTTVNILDGLGVGDDTLHESVARHDGKRGGAPEADAERKALFVAERWAASAAESSLLFVYVTKVATDTYWNYWTWSWALLVTVPFAPAQEQTAQAAAKGFLVDVRTGKIVETAGALATESRAANPVIVNRPIFQLEQEVARRAETRMIEQLAQKLQHLRERTR